MMDLVCLQVNQSTVETPFSAKQQSTQVLSAGIEVAVVLCH